MKCKTCKHYRPHEPEPKDETVVESGWCHFNPPQIYYNGAGVDCSFPWVHEDEQCSKHEN